MKSRPIRVEWANGPAELDELSLLKAYLATRPMPVPAPAEAPIPTLPFEPLPALSAAARCAVEAAALEANDRYLETFLEPSSFCPFSRGGRRRGSTQRIVYFADSGDVTPLLDHMAAVAGDPSKAVVQLILPLVEVTPEAWMQFCYALTAAGNDRLRGGLGEGSDVFAVAPLHPDLAYTTKNPLTIIPLFRRTPDPTIQWVRLDALKKLYAGRGGDTEYVAPEDIPALLARPRREPLFDRIAETNLRMAERLGVANVERTLRDLSRKAQERYARLLLSDGRAGSANTGCPHHRVPVSDTSPPRPALFERDGRHALVRLDELAPRVPQRFVAAGVEVVAVRVGDEVHVLHGRCSHRNAPLSDALVEDERLVCPHHGWDFQLATGRSEGVLGESVAHFRSSVVDGLVWIDGAELDAWRKTHVQVFHADDDVL